jgi:hypothetical protein
MLKPSARCQIGAKPRRTRRTQTTYFRSDSLISSREDRLRSSEFAPARDFGCLGLRILDVLRVSKVKFEILGTRGRPPCQARSTQAWGEATSPPADSGRLPRGLRTGVSSGVTWPAKSRVGEGKRQNAFVPATEEIHREARLVGAFFVGLERIRNQQVAGSIPAGSFLAAR